MVDRNGRLQLPREFTEPLGIRDRVRLSHEPGHVGVWPYHPDGPAGPPDAPRAANADQTRSTEAGSSGSEDD
jgi:hypothetical protein